MKVELKKVKYHEDRCRETACFSAVLYIDGKPAIDVGNSGTGGCNEMHDVIPGSSKRLEDYCKSLPKYKCPYSDELQTMNSEVFIGDLLSAYLKKQDLAKFKRSLTSNIVYTLNDKPGVWQTSMRKVKISPEIIAKWKARRPDVKVVLNELPFEDAAAIFLSNANQP